MAVEDAPTAGGEATQYIPETEEPTEEPAPTYDGGDPVSDESINQNIETFGDVTQDFDNEDVSGEGAVSAGDWSQVNTGEGATQAGGDIVDSTIASGDVAGSVTGDNYDSVVGDGNAVIDDSSVGAAGFGGGDATNLQGENLNLGDGTLVDDTFGDANVNSGDGDLNSIDDSYVSESALGDGDVYSDDPTVLAEGGSSVAFGEGSTSSAEDQDSYIEGNYGNVNVADDGNQSGTLDASTNDAFNTQDSFNSSFDATDASTNDSYNTLEESNYSLDATDASSSSEYTDASDDDYTYTDNSVSDDDYEDVDAGFDAGPAEGYDPGLGS